MTNCSLMNVKYFAECSLWSILQCLWPAFSDNRSSFEWPPKTYFIVFNLIFGTKMQLIVFSCMSYGLILAIWNALKPFSVTVFHFWPHTGGVPLDPIKIAYSVKWRLASEHLCFNLYEHCRVGGFNFKSFLYILWMLDISVLYLLSVIFLPLKSTFQIFRICFPK